MGVDVTIKNKQLFKKPLTVSDLTLGKYQCGVPDQYGRSSRKPGAGDLVIYDENRIGRGVVAFSWSGSVRNQIDLRLNSLSTYTDIDMFCEIVKNILCVWKAKKFEWDGVEYTEADLGNLIAEQKNFTLDLLADIDNVGKGRNDYITIPCALINLDLRKLNAQQMMNVLLEEYHISNALYIYGEQTFHNTTLLISMSLLHASASPSWVYL